ncbi:MAG: hypothetical protein FRX49_12026 [Trebouxia sp. A1-2]|nr:MAG: hypothetical protein FRX49_12026 [Trebouxia sp. A1-2]
MPGPEACNSLREGEACLPDYGASTTGAEKQSTKSSSTRNKELVYTMTELHNLLVRPNRYEEEVAPFQAEKSLTVETSEASPWTYLQKTYSNVEESAVSTAGQQHTCRKGRTTIDQEDYDTKICQHLGSTVQPRWQADEWPSRAAPESAWAESTPGLTTSGLPHANLHKLPAKQPSASNPAPAQADGNDLGIEDVDEFEAELAALNQQTGKHAQSMRHQACINSAAVSTDMQLLQGILTMVSAAFSISFPHIPLHNKQAGRGSGVDLNRKRTPE